MIGHNIHKKNTEGETPTPIQDPEKTTQGELQEPLWEKDFFSTKTQGLHKYRTKLHDKQNSTTKKNPW